MNSRFCFSALFLFGAIFQICSAEPTQLVRATPEFAEWTKESEAIIECYRENLKPTIGSKIVPLFVCVRLGLGDPVSEFGASVLEIAFVYSEARLENGTRERKVVILLRSPYQDRKWRWEPIAAIIEMGPTVRSFVLLDESMDLYKTASNFAKTIAGLNGERDHIISMIVFEKGISTVFGKDLDDDTLLQMISQDKADPVGKK